MNNANNGNPQGVNPQFVNPQGVNQQGVNQQGGVNPKNKKKKKKNKGTGARVAKRIISAALLISLGYGAHVAVDEIIVYKRALDLLKNYKDANVCLLPTAATSTNSYDIEIADGQKLVWALNHQDIDYCRIGDVYYTENGMDIAVITLKVVRRDVKSSVAVDSDKGRVYAAPEGYTIVGDDAYKDNEDVIIRVVPKSSSYSVNAENLASEGIVSAEIIDVFETTSQRISELKGKTLICDVKDNSEPTEDNNYPSTLRLVP